MTQRGKTPFVCDKCLREVYEVYELTAWPLSGESCPDSLTEFLGERHFCESCIRSLWRKPNGKRGKDSIDMTAVIGEKNKVNYISKANEQAIIELYRAGAEIEEISDKLGIQMSPISHLINDLGLGKERYGDKFVPSDGSAPVQYVSRIAARGGRRR